MYLTKSGEVLLMPRQLTSSVYIDLADGRLYYNAVDGGLEPVFPTLEIFEHLTGTTDGLTLDSTINRDIIKFNGLDQYMDTGYSPTENTRIEMSIRYDAYDDDYQFNGVNAMNSYCDVGREPDNLGNVLRADFGNHANNSSGVQVPDGDTSWYTITLDKNNFKVNQTSVPVSSTVFNTTALTLLLGAADTLNGARYHSAISCKYFKIYENGVLVRDYDFNQWDGSAVVPDLTGNQDGTIEGWVDGTMKEHEGLLPFTYGNRCVVTSTGTGEKILIPNLVGTESITWDGTATPTLAPGEITLGAGWISDIIVGDYIYPLEELSGSTVFDISGNGNHGELIPRATGSIEEMRSACVDGVSSWNVLEGGLVGSYSTTQSATIDLGFPLLDTDKIEIDMRLNNILPDSISRGVGQHDASSDARFYVVSIDGMWRYGFGAYLNTSAPCDTDRHVHTVSIDGCYLDGVHVADCSPFSGVSAKSFCIHSVNGLANSGAMPTIYSFKLWRSGVLTHHLIPYGEDSMLNKVDGSIHYSTDPTKPLKQNIIPALTRGTLYSLNGTTEYILEDTPKVLGDSFDIKLRGSWATPTAYVPLFGTDRNFSEASSFALGSNLNNSSVDLYISPDGTVGNYEVLAFTQPVFDGLLHDIELSVDSTGLVTFTVDGVSETGQLVAASSFSDPVRILSHAESTTPGWTPGGTLFYTAGTIEFINVAYSKMIGATKQPEAPPSHCADGSLITNEGGHVHNGCEVSIKSNDEAVVDMIWLAGFPSDPTGGAWYPYTGTVNGKPSYDIISWNGTEWLCDGCYTTMDTFYPPEGEDIWLLVSDDSYVPDAFVDIQSFWSKDSEMATRSSDEIMTRGNIADHQVDRWIKDKVCVIDDLVLTDANWIPSSQEFQLLRQWAGDDSCYTLFSNEVMSFETSSTPTYRIDFDPSKFRYACFIDWGDGNIEFYRGNTDYIEHVYDVANIRTIRIFGRCEHLKIINSYAKNVKLGKTHLKNLLHAFNGTRIVGDLFDWGDISRVHSFRGMFQDSDIGRLPDLALQGKPRRTKDMFMDANLNTQDITFDGMDTSACRTFKRMFSGATGAFRVTGLDTITLYNGLYHDAFEDFFTGTLDTAEYDLFIQRLSDEADSRGIDGITLGMGTSVTTNTTARDNLINNHNWVITDAT